MKWLYLGDGYHGRCRCRRFGMLNEIPHRRLIRGVLIVRTGEAGNPGAAEGSPAEGAREDG